MPSAAQVDTKPPESNRISRSTGQAVNGRQGEILEIDRLEKEPIGCFGFGTVNQDKRAVSHSDRLHPTSAIAYSIFPVGRFYRVISILDFGLAILDG